MEAMKSLHWLVLALFLTTALTQEIDYRLPDTLWPINYNLQLIPDIDQGQFKGFVLIQIHVENSTNQIILHSHGLTINEVSVVNADNENLQIENYQLETVREFLLINLRETLQENADIQLQINFEGEMKNKIVGLYSSSYWTENKERRDIATSKFEPTYARQAFPCFDEPAMKATFEISLTFDVRSGYHALSNMDQMSSITTGEQTTVSFYKSVPMSTYVACFIVSDLVHNAKPVNTNSIGENFDIRIFATAHQLNKVEFALDTAVAAVEFYIQYFQVEYPLPKLDMAAIPDFVSNAMEHWGLVTYRETALLYDESISSTWNKQRIAAVVSHELAHMWFGNLVTMKWWNDLWLNEGFARYMEYKAINEIYPDWGMPDQFLIHALHGVMKYDSTLATHQIIQTVENPDQITEIFDTISYEKGASIIRMLEHAVGSDNFAKAVTSYLKEFQYKNANTNDFISELEKLDLDFDVRLFLRTWTEQKGFPVLEVSRYLPNMVLLVQKRYFSNPEDYEVHDDDSPFSYKWNIPLIYKVAGISEEQTTWFNYNESFKLVVHTGRYVLFNVHQIGYYRVNYDEDIWQIIVDDLIVRPQIFDISDRALLLNDVFALADANQTSYEIALNMTQYLQNEEDFVPWYVAANKLQALQKTLMYTDFYVEYLQYARNLMEKIYQQVGWTVDTNNHLKNRLRVSILTAACSLGLTDCLNQAASKFNAWLADPQNNIPLPDLREIVYYYGMQRVNKQQAWEQMWHLFIAEQDASEKAKLMYGLAAVRLPWLLYRFIELAANEENVRRQDYFTCIQNIAANPVGESIVWDYVREHWPQLVTRFGLNERYLGRMIPSITEQFASETKLAEMTEFFAKYPEAGAGAASRKQALETVKYNIAWLKINQQKVSAWLRDNAKVA